MHMLVTVERDGPVAVVTMNRPEAMNALSRGLRAELAAAMKAIDEDREVRAVVLTGAGTRAFTAGLDLKEAVRHADVHQGILHSRMWHRAFHEIQFQSRNFW